MPTQPKTHNGVYVELNELLELRGMVRRKSEINRLVVNNALPGEGKSNVRGRGIEFFEVRPYQAGDDIRTIDWRMSARTGKAFTKLYAEEREKSVCIAVDQRVTMFFGSGAVFKSVVAARVAALIGWDVLSAGDRVGGIVMGEQIQRIRSGSTRRSLLQLLQSVTHANRALHAQSQSPESLQHMLHDCLTHASTGATVVVLSDFHDLDKLCLKNLIALAQKCQLLLLNISDPLEMAFPSVGSVGIGNGEETARVVIGKAQQHLYTEQRARKMQCLYACVDQCSARLLEVSTRDDAASTLKSVVHAQFSRR